MAVNSFRKALHRRFFKGFSICLGLGIWIMPGFYIWQGSEYSRVLNTHVSSEYARAIIMLLVLNMPGF